ncbi:hypothetical protein D3C86_1970490 [compost metagenome]
MFTETGQIHHKRLLEVEFDFLFDLLDVRIKGARDVCAGKIILPVRTPFQIHFLSGYRRMSACDG